MIRYRRNQILATLLLAILSVGVVLSAMYFALPPQTPAPTPLNVEINLIGEIDTGGGALRVHVEDDLAFVIDFGESDSHGLFIIDISVPSQPEILGEYFDGGLPFAIESAGDIVYIADQFEGLRIIDISDPSQPIQIEGYTGSGSSYDLEIVGDLLYLADGENGMVILDISSPSSPAFVSSYGIGCVHLDIEEDFAYITDHGTLKLVNISDPTHPILVGQYLESGSTLWDPSVSNSTIYLANHSGDDGELMIIDAQDPTHIEKMCEFNSEGTFQSFFLKDILLYAVDFESGLYLFDVSDPTSPTEIERFSDGGQPWDVVLDGDYIYLCGSEGLQILQLTYE